MELNNSEQENLSQGAPNRRLLKTYDQSSNTPVYKLLHDIKAILTQTSEESLQMELQALLQHGLDQASPLHQSSLA